MSDQYRCCGELEYDTFHIFECDNRILRKEVEAIEDSLFCSMLNWEVNKEVKEMIFQSLVGNERYDLPLHLSRIFMEMMKLGRRNLWYSFYPILLAVAMDYDIILARRYLLRLIKTTSLLMNKLWR